MTDEHARIGMVRAPGNSGWGAPASRAHGLFSASMTTIPRALWEVLSGLAGGGPWPPASEADAIKLFEFANQQHLLPLLMSDQSLPPTVLAMQSRYRALAAMIRKRSDLSLRAATELIEALGPQEFLFYKGSDYRHRLYDEPGHRVMGDIDILILPGQIDAALKRLTALGYVQVFSNSIGSYAPGYHEKRILVGDVLVELHRSFGQRVRSGIDYGAMWSRRESFARDGISGYRLAPADAILCHAFNLGKDEFSPELNRYVDFYLLLQHHANQLPACVELAKAWGIERALFGALHITTSLFAELRNDAIRASMERLLDHPTRKFLIERVLPDAASEHSGNVLGRRVQIWRKFMLMDKWWRRVAFVGYHLYATGAGSVSRNRRNRR